MYLEYVLCDMIMINELRLPIFVCFTLGTVANYK